MRSYRLDRRQYALLTAAAAILLLFASSLGAARVHAQEPTGDTIVFEECTSVTLHVQASDADYTSFFWRFGPDSELGVSSKQAGEQIVLGEVPAGELILGIYVNDTGNTFKTGPGSRNADGLVHADVSGSTVGFEDILGGGDFDYNDAVLEIETGPCARNVTLALEIEPSSTGAGGLAGGGSYALNAVANPNAVPSAGSSFGGWSGDCGGFSQSIAVVMDSDRTCLALFLADVTATPTPTPTPPPPPPPSPPPVVEGASVGIENTRTSPSPAQVGDQVTFRIDVALTAVPEANEAEVLVEFDDAFLSYASASWDGGTFSECQLIGIGIACDFGQVSGDFSFNVHFTALAVTNATATEATLGADFDGPGAGGPTVAGPASADVAVVDVAGVQLPPLGDGSSALSASGAASLPLVALVVTLGAVLGLALGTLRQGVIRR